MDKTKINDYNSNWSIIDIDNAWNNNIKAAYEHYSEHISSNKIGINYHFIWQYNPINKSEYFNNDVNNYIKENNIINENDVIDDFNLYENLQKYLSDKGNNILNIDITSILFNEKINEYSVLYTLKQNLTNNGLIPLYRAISYTNKEYYDGCINDKVGIYWSFDYDGAVPYKGRTGYTLILCAYVKPEYINWTQTIYKSVWYLNYEKEIELKNDIDILIYKIVDYKSGKSIKLEKKLIVKT